MAKSDFSRADEKVEKKQAGNRMDKFMNTIPDFDLDLGDETPKEEKNEPVKAEPEVRIVPEVVNESERVGATVGAPSIGNEGELVACITTTTKKGDREPYTTNMSRETKENVKRICMAFDINQVDFFDNVVRYFNDGLQKETKKRLKKKFNI